MKLSIKVIAVLLLFVDFSFAQAPNFSIGLKGGSTRLDIGHSIAVDPDGNFYVTFEFGGPITFGSVSLNTPAVTGNFDFGLVKFDSTGNALWGISGGGTLTDRGYGVAIDNIGMVYACGELFGTAIFGTDTLISTGNLDGFLFKVDPSNGNYIWKKQMKSVSQLATRGIAIDNNNDIYVAGYFGSTTATTANFDGTIITTYGGRDIFLAKYSSAGSLVWVKNFGGVNSSEEGRSVAVDASGNVYLTGTINGTANFDAIQVVGNPNGSDMFMTKLTSTGTVVWVSSGGGPTANGDDGNGIAVDLLGNVYVTGKMDSAAVFGTTTLISAGGQDAYIAKYDNSGNLMWVHNGGGPTNDYGYEVVCDANNNAALLGSFTGTAHFGNDSLVSAGGDDIFILQVDPSGGINYLKHPTGSDVDKVFGADIDAGGNLYMTGSFKGTLNLDTYSFTTSGVEDIYAARLGNNPVPVELTAFTASVNVRDVILNWQTSTEKNNSGFQVQKSTDRVSYSDLAFIPGKGTTTETSRYSFTDENISLNKVFYRLKQIDYNGSFSFSPSVEVNLETPEVFSLLQNYPNPFNPSTSVSFALPVDASVSICIYNSVGEKVKEFYNQYGSGNYSVTIDGSALSSGVYFYRIYASGKDGSIFTASKKMILIK